MTDVLRQIGFADIARARTRFQALCRNEDEVGALTDILPNLLYACLEAADAEVALTNLERYVSVVPNRLELFRFLNLFPRGIEILVRLFVGSQYLTELLLRNPRYLEQLTNHRQLADFKSREDFLEVGSQWLTWAAQASERPDELRRFQQWELLRIAACDTFGLLDFKTVILQLSLLADSIVELALRDVFAQAGLDRSQFVVLAFGKLGGEELNYSSDIDLVFLTDRESEKYWGAARKLIRVLSDVTSHGFLYRVDMRLRPWGKSGPLVTTVEGYIDYYKQHAQYWERQALLKARPIAGNLELGNSALRRLRESVTPVASEEVRHSIREMKREIERKLELEGRTWGEVKGGPGGIRDIEFLTQWLQLQHGSTHPQLQSGATLEALSRLTEAEFLLPGEFRRLNDSYYFLRTVEHSLQLMHNRQEHAIPESPRAQDYLARRLDFPDAAYFVEHFNRHTREVRTIFLRHLGDPIERGEVETELGIKADHNAPLPSTTWPDDFSPTGLLERLAATGSVQFKFASDLGDDSQLVVAGHYHTGALSVLCGLLYANGMSIESGLFSIRNGKSEEGQASHFRTENAQFIAQLTIRHVSASSNDQFEAQFDEELHQHFRPGGAGLSTDMRNELVNRVAYAAVEMSTQREALPVDIEIDEDSEDAATVLRIQSTDTPGFLYELANALETLGLLVIGLKVATIGTQVQDELRVVDVNGKKVTSRHDLKQLRATIVLVQHFIHALPLAPNPAAALTQFRELLEEFSKRPDWPNDLARLDNSEVLQALSRLLGGSEFLWDNFLRIQHKNLFPVVTDVDLLQTPKSREQLTAELKTELAAVPAGEHVRVLNEFKDREILRIDLRHVLGLQHQFGMFSRELASLAETIVEGAYDIAFADVASKYGEPKVTGKPAQMAICALGKFGGLELGFASDIELLFLFDGTGRTSGRKRIDNGEFFNRVVETFRRTIDSRKRRIFEIDLRLRPYGSAGTLAVPLKTFIQYYAVDGPAWPYERQALVKLRPAYGPAKLCDKIVAARDKFLYTGTPFDVSSMRAMRERQLRQLVKPDVFNVKLSRGGLVDCEYLVQALQITHGHRDESLRSTNTREALKALAAHGVVTPPERLALRDAYRFLRRVIDALRMVRGDATDLDIPPSDSEQFQFLGRRLGYHDINTFRHDIETHVSNVRQLSEILLAQIPQSQNSPPVGES
ncbi:MAG: glutamine synthetase adenylyltransferase [Planctomycetaceae bacterium]